MKTSSLIAAICVSMFAAGTQAAVIESQPALSAWSPYSAAGVVGVSGLITDDGGAGEFAFVDEAAVKATALSSLAFDRGQYLKLDNLSVEASKISALEPNSLYMFLLGLLALFVARRKVAQRGENG